MMQKRSFREALVDADRALAAIPLPAARDREIRAALVAPRRFGWRVPVLAGAAALAVVAAFFVMRAPEPKLVAFQPPAPQVGWRAHGDEIEVIVPTLVVDAAGFGRITATRGSRFVRAASGVRVVSGRVEFEVTHRSQTPALVHVSHGTIAVLGTRFVVEQHADGGRVTLHEGKIRFTGARTVDLAPGQSLAWPLAPPPAEAAKLAPPRTKPVVSVERATPPPQASTPFDVDKLLAELASLRASRRFADAATLLERALTETLPTATRERLSYELGAIATYQLAQTDRACRHWHAHRERFPQGRYGDEIEAAMRRLGCKEIP